MIAFLIHRLKEYALLTRMNRPIGSLLLLWPTFWGLWLASPPPFPKVEWILIFTLGTFLMRSAGCAINDYADRHFDAHVERTKNRPLAEGRIHPKEAVYVALGLSLMALGCAIPLGQNVLILSLPAVFLAGSYPFTKRFFALPQAYLGVAFGFGIPMAYAAVQNTVPWEAWCLLFANLFWTLAYDTAYAMTDREHDLKIGIKTAAITFGEWDVMAIMTCHFIFLALLVGLGFYLQLGWLYFIGILIAGLLMIRQYQLIIKRYPTHCFQAFLENNQIGCAIFLGIAAERLTTF